MSWQLVGISELSVCLLVTYFLSSSDRHTTVLVAFSRHSSDRHSRWKSPVR